MRNRFFMTVASICFAFLAGCESSERISVEIELLDTPSATESFAPQLFSVDGRTSLSWLESTQSGHALRYAEWQDEGWHSREAVAHGDDWFANWADLPGVRPRAGGGWVAWWLQKSGPDTYAYDVQLAMSDDGANWQRLGTPHHDGTQTEHGFASVFDMADGTLGIAWLDGRKTAPGQSGHQHDHAGDKGAGMTLRYGSFADGEQHSEDELDALVCDCCQTSTARAGDATVLVYRDRTEDETRDIYASRQVDGEWEEPVRVHADNWKIPGCPVNGPAVAADGDLVAVTWFTAPQGKGEVRLALSKDGGRSFAPPVRIDDDRPEGRVDVIIHPQQGVMASWLEKTSGGAEVRLRRVNDDGTAGDAATLLDSAASRATGFPRMVALADGTVLMTWTHVGEDGRQVRSARLHL